MQRLLEEEVTDLLGRGKSVRRAAVDPAPGSRNGHGRARRLTLSSGTITVRRPRLRGLAERFESRVLPLFQRRTQEVGRLLPELYLHGLALGDFTLALRGLLGEGAPLSPSAIARLTATWQGEFAQWRARSLADLDVVYLWADGLYVKAGLEDSKAALLVVIGALTDGRKVILAVEPGHRESTEAWAGVLRGLHARGLRAPRLTVADGHLGLWGALRGVYPESGEQRCWNHRIVNVLDTVPLKQQAEVRLWLRQLAYAETRAAAERLRAQFAKQYRARHPQAVERLEHDWEAARRVLCVPARPLAAASPDDQRGGVAVSCGAPADDGGEALQEGGERDGADLEGAHASGAHVSEAQRAAPAAGSLRGRRVRRRRRGQEPRGTGRRLMPFTHFLTRPLIAWSLVLMSATLAIAPCLG